MRVLFVGHSYVKNLEQLPGWDQTLELNNGQQVPLDLRFRSRPGKDYQFFLDNAAYEFASINSLKPEAVIVILGGNSISNDISNSDINQKALDFYRQLREAVGPHCLVLGCQVEARYYSEGNRFNAPLPVEFNRRRHVINNYLNKSLRKKGLVNNVVLLGGSDYLSDPENFEDGVHLKPSALDKYRAAVLGCLKNALSRRV